MKKIFFSYSQVTSSKDIAKQLQLRLNKKKYSFEENSLRKWNIDARDEINEKIKASDFFLLILSKKFLDDFFPIEELEFAKKLSKENFSNLTIIVILDLNRDVEKSEYRPFIKDCDYVLNSDGNIQNLVDNILEILNSKEIAIKSYRKWALGINQGLDLIGVGGAELRLDVNDVYVPLRLVRRLQLEDIGKVNQNNNEKYVIFEEIFSQNKTKQKLLVIMGDPGAGKTTILRKILYQCFDKKHGPASFGLDPETIPVLLRLSRFSSEDLKKPFVQLLKREIEEMFPREIPPDFATHILGRGKLILLFDGLDEIADDNHRIKVCYYINKLQEKLKSKHIHFVITCRFATANDAYRLGARYKITTKVIENLQSEDVPSNLLKKLSAHRNKVYCGEHRIKKYLVEKVIRKDEMRFLPLILKYSLYNTKFDYLDIIPLDNDQVASLIKRWFRAAYRFLNRTNNQPIAAANTEAEHMSNDLIKALNSKEYGSHQIKVLLASPLLLTLLCLIRLRGEEMPKRRVEFYRGCLNVLLQRRNITQPNPKPLLDVSTTFAILRPLAYKLHKEKRKDDLRFFEFISFATQRVAALNTNSSPFEILSWLHRHTGVLEEYSRHKHPLYGFVHLGLQEFLTAREIASKLPQALDEIGEQLVEDWWQEVLYLLVGLPNQRIFEPLMKYLLQTSVLIDNPELILACIDQAHEVEYGPFLEVLHNDQEPQKQAAVLRLLQGITSFDTRITNVAGHLTSSENPEVARLARLLVDTTGTSVTNFNAKGHLFLAYDITIRKTVEQMVAEIGNRKYKVWSDIERLSAEDSNFISWDKFVSQINGALIFVGPDGNSLWHNNNFQDFLTLLINRETPILLVMLPHTNTIVPEIFERIERFTFSNDLGSKEIERLRSKLNHFVVSKKLFTFGKQKKPPAGETFIENATKLKFLWIPAGRFKMGDYPPVALAQPPHIVEMSGFWITETPITNRQYAIFIKATGYKEPLFWLNNNFSAANQPIVGISWKDTFAFCKWLSFESALNINLPTEAQWEFAARGTDNRKYPWGNEKPYKKAFYGNNARGPAKVNSHFEGRGPFGTLNQAGNIWEWCLDSYNGTIYKKRAEKGRVIKNPFFQGKDEDLKMLRGGSWNSPPEDLFAAYRFRIWPDVQRRNIGFRIVCIPSIDN